MFFTKREKLLLSIILILAIALSGTVYMNLNKASAFITGTVEESEGEKTEQNEDMDTNTERLIGIHIGGQVKNPGFIWIEEGKRIYDAIKYVGGVLPEADLDLVNLSEKLRDEEKIYIPKKGDAMNESVIQSDNRIGVVDRNTGNDKININNATEAEIGTLPGIGPVLAKRIVEHRNSTGLFKTAEDIRSVSGIGEKRFAEIKDLIIVK
ncbi:MAG: hypothetical protein GX154_05090 [Clostridiales bacterium]|nr:hypothetical protein [Clostridiales bacterium]